MSTGIPQRGVERCGGTGGIPPPRYEALDYPDWKATCENSQRHRRAGEPCEVLATPLAGCQQAAHGDGAVADQAPLASSRLGMLSGLHPGRRVTAASGGDAGN